MLQSETSEHSSLDLDKLFTEKSIHIRIMDPANALFEELLPDERFFVRDAILKRKREFSAGRIIARQLLKETWCI